MTTRGSRSGSPSRMHAQLRSATSGLNRLDVLLLATLFTVTFTKLYWDPFGKLVLSQLLAIVFVAAFAGHRIARRNARVPQQVAVVAGFMLAFAVVYAFGFFNLETPLERTQFYKGIATWSVRAAFLLCAAAYIAERGRRLFLQCVLVFVAGTVLNAVYGVLQLVVFGLLGGRNLDDMVLTPLGFSVEGSRGIQFFGAGIHRINGLMRDTNHLGVMLAAPIALGLVYLRGVPRIVVTSILTGALLLSLSRSGWVGAAAALAVLALPQRRRLVSRQVVVPLLLFAVALVAFTRAFPELTNSIILSRFDLSTGSSQTHLRLYTLIPAALQEHPLFGTGLNSFAIHFEKVSGRPEFGPHSYYVQLLTETGMVGFSVFVAFAAWLLTLLTRTGSLLGAAIAAALVGTWFGNLFYLTAHIIYVDALYALAVAAPVALADRIQSERSGSVQKGDVDDVRAKTEQ